MDVPQRLGKYEIRGTLGRGAMGVVYDGFDPQIARRVAIKSVPLPDNPDPDTEEEIARFRREAQAAGRLSHPNIVGVYDYGETSDVAYIVMEHVDGPTLKTLLDKKERFPLDSIARVMGDLLAGLQFSHERGVVHRDIKPGNIMLTKGGQAKIADFGIARIEMSSMTQAGTMLGTPAYMSPEQFRGEVADARTDVYSAGVLLYQLLTGDRPFEGGLTTIMHKVLNTDPPAPSQLASTAPAALDAVVRKAMAKRPEDRYASAAAFADALRAALAAPAKAPAAMADDDDSATLVRPATPRPGPPAPPPPSAPSSPPPAVAKSKAPLFAGVGVAALLVLGGAGWFFTRATPPPEQVAQVSPPTPMPPTLPGPTAPETKPAATVAPSLADGQATPQPSTTAPATTTATEPPPTPPPVTPQPVTPQPVVAPQPVTPPPPAVSQPVVTKPPTTAPIVTQPAVTQPAASKPVVASKPAEPPPAPPPPAQPTTTTTLAVEPPAPPPAALAPPAKLPAPPPAQTTTTAAATSVQPTTVQPSLVQPSTKPAEPLATAVPAVPVPQLPPPPPAAQTTTTTAPTQTAAAASAIVSQIARAVQAARCTLATATPQDSGTLTVQGVGDGAAMAALRRQVDAIQGAPPTIWLVRTIDPAFCPVLALLRPISPLAGVPGPGVSLTLADNRVVLPDGDAILPRLTMPDFAGEIRVDYLSRDGSVAHLYPTLADNSDPAAKLAAQPSRRLAAGEHLALGDPGPGKPQWQSGTPYGTDMIVAVASSTPLHVAPAHNAEEKGDAYVADLGRAIEQARAAGARVSGALLLVETVAKK